MEKIIEKELVVGGVYRISSRNLDVSVWDGEKFIGIRRKFNTKLLDSEYPARDGFVYGTVTGSEKTTFSIGGDIRLSESLGTRCYYCGTECGFEHVSKTWWCGGGCEKPRGMLVRNGALFDTLTDIEDEIYGSEQNA